MQSVSFIDMAIVIIYYCGIIVLGFVVSRSVKKRGFAEFAMSSKSQGMFTLFCSVAATHIGSGLCLGLVGKLYADGMQAVWIAVGYFTGTILFTACLARKIRERAKVEGWGVTMGDVFEDAYGRGGRTIYGIVAAWERIGVLAGQLVAIGILLSMIFSQFGLSQTWGTIIAGIVIVIYVTLGGLKAVIYSDTIQCCVMIAGIGITLPIILLLQVPVGELFNAPAASPEFYSLKPSSLVLIATVFSWGTSGLANQNIWARIVAAKDVKTAYKANIFGAGFGIFWGFLMCIIACSMKVVYPAIEGSADSFLLQTIVHSFPIGITGLILAAVLANVVSTADSVLMNAVLNISHDIYKNTIFHNKEISDAQILRFSRICTPFVCIVPVVLGIYLPLIIEVQNLGYAVYGAGIAVPFWVAILSKKKLSHKAAIAAIIVGFVVSAYFYMNKIIIPNSIMGMIFCGLVFYIVNKVDKNKEAPRVEQEI